MKTILLLLLAECTFGQATQPALSQPPEKRLALVIGNSKYTNGDAAPTAVNDAKDMATMLTKLGFEVLLHTNLDRAAMEQTMNEFSGKLSGYPIGLIYYAGQGLQLQGQQFLVPVDAKVTSETAIESACISVKQLVVGMDAAKAKTNIILLDADRNNPFGPDTLRRSSGGSVDTPIGFVVSYSTSPGKISVSSNSRNRLYTAALLKVLPVANQSVGQLFQQVRVDVLKQSDNKQLPWESTSLTEDFYFQRK